MLLGETGRVDTAFQREEWGYVGGSVKLLGAMMLFGVAASVPWYLLVGNDMAQLKAGQFAPKMVLMFLALCVGLFWVAGRWFFLLPAAAIAQRFC